MIQSDEPIILPNQVICPSATLEESGDAFRFQIKAQDIQAWVGTALHRLDHTHPAFVFRFRGQVYAYLNRCAHVAMEMDWKQGDFFSDDKCYLVCATHDAHYEPHTGKCISGPCPKGAALVNIPIYEKDGDIYLA